MPDMIRPAEPGPGPSYKPRKLRKRCSCGREIRECDDYCPACYLVAVGASDDAELCLNLPPIRDREAERMRMFTIKGGEK